MTEFVLIGTESINPDHVARAVWSVAKDGRDAHVEVRFSSGEIQAVPVGHPAAKRVAEAFGLGELYAAWPKAKAAADAKFAEEKKLREQRVNGRTLQRA